MLFRRVVNPCINLQSDEEIMERITKINQDEKPHNNKKNTDDVKDVYVITNRKKRLSRDKIYVQMYKTKWNDQLRISLGLNILELLNFSFIKPLSITFDKNNHNIINVFQNENSNLKASLATGANVVTIRFNVPSFLLSQTSKTSLEVDFDFKNNNELIIDLGRYYDQAKCYC